MVGQFELRWSEAGGTQILDMGVPTGFSPQFSKSISKFPLVTRSYTDTVGIEARTTLHLQITYTRKEPISTDDNSTDSTKWSNERWIEGVNEAMDRWQVMSDGFTIVFNTQSLTPSKDRNEDLYYRPVYSGFPAVVRNGYISSLSVKYKEGIPDVLTGDVTVSIGSMTVKNKRVR